VAKARERINAALGLAPGADLRPLLGNDLVVARTQDGLLGAWVVKDEAALRAIVRRRPPSPDVRIVVRGPLVVAGTPGAVREALATKARQAGMTRRLFEERLLGMRANALVRGEANAALIPTAQRSRFPWVRSLRRVAFSVLADDRGLHAGVRATTAPTPPDAVPIATGADAPLVLDHGSGISVGIRDLRHTIRAGLAALKTGDPATYRRYDLARRALKLFRRGDIDHDVIDQLGGDATLWSPDLRSLTLTARVSDPGRMAHALNGLKPLMGRLLTAAGLDGARYGVVGDTLVITTIPGVALAGVAAGRLQRVGELNGAVVGLARGPSLRQILIDRLGLPPLASIALGPLGDASFSIETSATGLVGGADLAISGG